MARWTRVVLRFRWPILASWLVILLAGGIATAKLAPLLSNSFTVPGTDSERAREILQEHFGDRSDGEYLVVFRTPGRPTPAQYARLQGSMRRGAREVRPGRSGALLRGSDRLWYGSITSTMPLAEAKGHSDEVLRALD